jgi:hypothetical protein
LGKSGERRKEEKTKGLKKKEHKVDYFFLLLLELGTYASLEGVYYCKPHFKQLFAAKGNTNSHPYSTNHL